MSTSCSTIDTTLAAMRKKNIQSVGVTGSTVISSRYHCKQIRNDCRFPQDVSTQSINSFFDPYCNERYLNLAPHEIFKLSLRTSKYFD